MSGARSKIDVEFTLALHNRTGKYFIGRDIIAQHKDQIGNVYYWRFARPKPPEGLAAKFIGKCVVLNHMVRRSAALDRFARFRPTNAVLHLDPFTVLHSRLEARDIVLCHDLGPITHPDLFSSSVVELYQRAYAEIQRRRPTMVFVSRASRLAFDDRYPGVPDQHVIYPPIRSELVEIATAPAAIAGSPYLLTVGSVGRRKNQLAAIRAFAMSGLAEKGWSYVLCGSSEPGADEVSAAAAVTPGVKRLPYVSDAELRSLYAHAAGFVLPSLLEGFGVPVAEAISHGLIPIISKDSVLEEVAGPGAISIDPLDLASIRDGMLWLAEMKPDERSHRANMLKNALDRFSSDKFDRDWATLLRSHSES
jgi:glycosyltransferase involved in cell wall biosynthesis